MASIIVSILFFAWRNSMSPVEEFPKSGVSSLSTTTSAIPNGAEKSWVTYENTKYGYKLKYPDYVFIQKSIDMDSDPITESVSITLRDPVALRGVAITGGKIFLPHYFGSAYSGKNWGGDLMSLAKALQQHEQEDPNFWVEKEVGEVQEVRISSTTGYLFSHKEYPSDFALEDAKKQNIPISLNALERTFLILKIRRIKRRYWSSSLPITSLQDRFLAL